MQCHCWKTGYQHAQVLVKGHKGFGNKGIRAAEKQQTDPRAVWREDHSIPQEISRTRVLFPFQLSDSKMSFFPAKAKTAREQSGVSSRAAEWEALATGSADTGHSHAGLCRGCPPSKAPAAPQKHRAVSRECYRFTRPTITNLWLV